MTQKHKNYDILNMIGFGLAKFDKEFIHQFGFKTKSDFYQFLVDKKVADSKGAVKSRQDMLDPFFTNPRVGWLERQKQYKHRFTLIDSLFGKENVQNFADVVKIYLNQELKLTDFQSLIKPITQSKFRQMQETGLEAELYFINNYELISLFKGGSIEDARLFGDGYDFQLNFADESFYLAEVKGLKLNVGSVRFTEKEIIRAEEHKDNYFLVVVNNLIESPQFSVVENPIKNLKLKKQIRDQKPVIEFLSENLKWQPWKNNLTG